MLIKVNYQVGIWRLRGKVRWEGNLGELRSGQRQA